MLINLFETSRLPYVPAVSTLKNVQYAHRVYLCVLYGFQNKLRLFTYTALANWFLQPCLVHGTNCTIIFKLTSVLKNQSRSEKRKTVGGRPKTIFSSDFHYHK